jgi:predicted CopG family antitoxin
LQSNEFIPVPLFDIWFINLVQKNHKNISLHDETYEELKRMGALTESFDDVIRKLIQKAASGQSSFEGRIGQTAVVDRNNPEVITAK